ncbi:MAG: hypothetical protein A4S15_13850 [Candidatus Raskinella chloraquaticus]|jgi:hypothetical protein|uniref:Uncharacterized protein n=1 Tax=Candidatus Raskinella chloraquaticus TaxID=1951219 RepID=A0A1W9HR69_9HYPH|nr:MAG: hypothetical protein A4S15_13850 [Proteobacteria bacterium SG_bin8]
MSSIIGREKANIQQIGGKEEVVGFAVSQYAMNWVKCERVITTDSFKKEMDVMLAYSRAHIACQW